VAQPASRSSQAPAAQDARRAPAHQETEQGPSFGEKIEVREVLLDALVTDRQGKVIVGLNRNDFAVSENGKPVELTGVAFYSNRRLVGGGSTALAGRGVSAEQAPEDRYFILFVQDQRFRTRGDDASEGSRLLARQVLAGRQIKEWVDREVLPNDWVAVVGYDAKLKVYQDLTHDHSQIESAINDAIKGRDVENNWPSRLPAPGAGPSLLTGLPRGTELRARTPTIFEAIQVLARAAGNIAARKNLVLLTSGGFEELSTAPYHQFMPDKRYFIPTTEALNSNNVAVYPVDLWPPGQISHTSDDVLNLLAAETGGRYIFNVNNFTNALGDISAENNGYYLLSYRSEHAAGSSGFQKVEVRTTNPELKVKARQGYEWGPGPAAAAAAAR
jgi:VWFA-related protein